MADLEKWFVPGRRSSVVIVPFVIRKDESQGGVRDRMLGMVDFIRGAKMQTENLVGDATVWAAISKPRAQRLTAGHAGRSGAFCGQVDRETI